MSWQILFKWFKFFFFSSSLSLSKVKILIVFFFSLLFSSTKTQLFRGRHMSLTHYNATTVCGLVSQHGTIKVKRLRTSFPKISHFGTWTILSWRQSRHCGIKRNVFRSLSYLEGSKSGGPICRAGQTSNSQTPALLIILWIALHIFKVPGPDSFPELKRACTTTQFIFPFLNLMHVGFQCLQN